MDSRIDLYLISGFLGTGKTTFLQHMIKNMSGKKIGIIVNEFGAIGIDGKILEQDGIKLVEINNGSIFCSCLKSNFVSTLIAFTKQPIDVLLIENSGMADPSNMRHLLDELKGKTERPYYYHGSVCIIDPVHFLKHVQILTPVQNQVATSNLLIINKVDLTDSDTIRAIEQKVLELNPNANIYQTSYSKVPFEVLEAKLFDSGYVGETSNQTCNRPSTYSLECEGEFTRKELITFIQRLQPYILRMKGFINVKDATGGAEMWHVDVVEEQINVGKAELGGEDIQDISKFVIIGKNSNEFTNEIECIWKQLFSNKVLLLN